MSSEPYTVTVVSSGTTVSFGRSALGENMRMLAHKKNKISVSVASEGLAAFFEDVEIFSLTDSLDISQSVWVQLPTEWMIPTRRILKKLPNLRRVSFNTLHSAKAKGMRGLFKTLGRGRYHELTFNRVQLPPFALEILAENLLVNKTKELRSFRLIGNTIDETNHVKLLQALGTMPHLDQLVYMCMVEGQALKLLEEIVLSGRLRILKCITRHVARICRALRHTGIQEFSIKDDVWTSSGNDVWDEELCTLIRRTPLEKVKFPVASYEKINKALESNYTIVSLEPIEKRIEGHQMLLELLERNKELCYHWKPEKYSQLAWETRIVIRDVMRYSYCSSILSLLPREIYWIIFSYLLYIK